jgi:hypothetical protein
MSLQIRAGDVPELIKKTAKEIAGCFYDGNRSEQFRQGAGTQDHFVKRQWKHYVPAAVTNLAELLALPGFPEDQKLVIYEAITEFSERMHNGKPKHLSLRNWQ